MTSSVYIRYFRSTSSNDLHEVYFAAPYLEIYTGPDF